MGRKMKTKLGNEIPTWTLQPTWGTCHIPTSPMWGSLQGSLSLQCLEIVVCTALEHYKGKTLLELDIVNSTSKVILCSGGETMRLTFSKVILQG
jgi:hypothetical protein